MILDEIAAKTAARVARRKAQTPAEELRRRAEALERPRYGCFARALAEPGMSFICEVKKASPSKGRIVEDFPYVEIARQYEAAGASALSVLTEPDFFLGSDAYLREIRAATALPILRKDFTIDAYQIYESVLLGADAVLLICALLDAARLAENLRLCRALRIEALVEAHDEEEVRMALDAGAEILGVNNRNLQDFTVDIGNSIRLRALAPAEVRFVAESGMKTREDIARLEAARVDGVLIGETLMRSTDKARLLRQLKGLEDGAAETVPLQ